MADASFVVDIRDPQKVFDILDKEKPDVVLPVPIGRYQVAEASSQYSPAFPEAPVRERCAFVTSSAERVAPSAASARTSAAYAAAASGDMQ